MTTKPTAAHPAPILRTIDELTSDWLSAALHGSRAQHSAEVIDVKVEPIGTGQMSRVFHVTPTYAGDGEGMTAGLIVKIASEDPSARGAGQAMGLYAAEVNFYREVAPRVTLRTPACRFAELDETDGAFTLLFDDRPGLGVGDMIAGGSVDQAATALAGLTGLQVPTWNSTGLATADWLSVARWRAFSETFPASLEPFLTRFGAELAEDEIRLCERIMPDAASWLDRWTGPGVVQHGDYRLDNMLFGPSGEFVVFDWQTARFGPPLVDVGFYLGGCLSIDDRRTHAEDLLSEYHQRLVAAGIGDYSWDQCRRDYARYALYGLLGFVGTYLHVEVTPRGEGLYLAAFKSYARQVLDLEEIS